MEEDQSTNPKSNLALASVVILVLFILIIGGVYYWVSNKTKEQVVFPAGINYLGPKQSTNLNPVPTLNISQIGKTGQWLQTGGKIFKYKFIYPAELKITAFINDPTDKLAWVTGITPPQQSIVFNVESMSSLDKKYLGKPSEFINNFWRRFSGLSGVTGFEEVQNGKGLKGYKVIYLDKAGRQVTTNYFFPVPGDDDHILQVTNGILPADIFVKIVNSVEFGK